MAEPDFGKTFFPAGNFASAISKMRWSPIFEKHFRKYAGKTGFLAFSQAFFISFIRFFAQRYILAMPKTWLSLIFEKNFFPAENPENMLEIAVFANFHCTFSIFLVFFHIKYR